MEMNGDFALAWDYVEHTAQSIFLTGNAGTGKTTFLKTVIQRSKKRMVVVAPTGVAAINAGGVTIHSFFQLPLRPFVPGMSIESKFQVSADKRKILRTIDLLIIDEISMVRSDLLDAIDTVMRQYRQPDSPFGGVQLLMIGDLQQLTPVVTPQDAEILRPYYSTSYFFGSKALENVPYITLFLTKIYRQQNQVFINVLNNLRNGLLTNADLALLNSRYNPTFEPDGEEGYIRLTTHNQQAERYNISELAKLTGKTYLYNANIEGTFPEYSYPTGEQLTFKVGAQVMFIKNDSSAEHQYYNGKIGRIVYLDNDKIEVLCPTDSESIMVEKQIWENTTYTINQDTKEIERQVQGTFCQFPLRLAWAITIHKSQGLTFDKAIIDAGLSFASGQVYVALSRCRSLEGMVLASPITEKVVIYDPDVELYISKQEASVAQTVAQLPMMKQEYERYLLAELFRFKDLMLVQERISRLFIEYFHDYPRLKMLCMSNQKALQEKVDLVAKKWVNHIYSLPIAQIYENNFQERIKLSTQYFYKTLKQYLPSVLNELPQVTSKNRTVMQRFKQLSVDFKELYIGKQYLLKAVSKQGFETSAYLMAKQEALIEALNDGKAQRKRSKRAVAAADMLNQSVHTAMSSSKKAKEDTKTITLKMYKKGMCVEKIAQERDLKASTILNHLAHFVALGQLSEYEFLTKREAR